MASKIFLVGMPGAGKTTFGKQLAEALQWPFLDLDQAIEDREEKSITEIFADKGEMAFRVIENGALKALAVTVENQVIATGGGAPCFHNNMELMNRTGKTLFLDPEITILVKRVSQEDQRPLFHGTDVKTKLDALYAQRAPIYRQAHVHSKSDKPEVEEIIKRLELA